MQIVVLGPGAAPGRSQHCAYGPRGVIFAKQNEPEEHKPWAIINVKEPQYPQYINVIKPKITNPHIRRVRSLANHRCLVFRKKKFWIKCVAPVIPSYSLQWKSDESSKHSPTWLKCCLPSTDAIDRREKNSRMRMKVQGRLMQGRFIQIHNVFLKNKFGYFSNRLVYCISMTLPKC